MHPRRECTDFHALQVAEARGLPLLAICLGIQEWNVSRGGTLHQHIPALRLKPHVAHRDGPNFVFHPVQLARGSLLHSIVDIDPLPVNSSHHQCVDRLGNDLAATAWAADGMVEAVEDPRRSFALGIQWHPEDMPDDPLQRKIFQALVTAAQNRRNGS
jgi:putative glutamine amidotransferase